MTEKQKRQKENFIDSLYPETGKLSRHNYPKHMEFFRAGSEHRERLMLAANRVGKTMGVGGYEVALHLTGEYPDWWEGRRFSRGIRAWAAGDTGETTRDIIQAKLLGPVGEHGTGLIRAKHIIRKTPAMGLPDKIKDVYVRHVSGQYSVLSFKSFDQKRISFQGTEQDVIWLDEEPDLGVYVECLMRTMTTKGLVICTFTPMKGLSDVVTQFLPGGKL